jgi:DNA-binding XRE family transcriptional regulator
MNSAEGQITSCATAGCGWRCCEFQQGNYIVLYPGELEAAKSGSQPTAHLRIIDADYHGGKKSVCTAKCTASCDGGLKPLDLGDWLRDPGWSRQQHCKGKGDYVRRKMIPVEESFVSWRKDPKYVTACNALDEGFSLAKAIIEARVHAGLTQEQLAGRMDTTQAVIARLESGRVKPSTRTLERVAAATGMRLRISFEAASHGRARGT